MQKSGGYQIGIRLRDCIRNQSGHFNQMVDVRFGGFSLSFLTGVLDGSELSGLQNGLNGFQRGVCFVWVGHFLVCQTLRPLRAGWTSGGAPQSSSTQNKFSSALWKSRWKSLAVLRQGADL